MNKSSNNKKNLKNNMKMKSNKFKTQSIKSSKILKIIKSSSNQNSNSYSNIHLGIAQVKIAHKINNKILKNRQDKMKNNHQ